MPARRRPLPIGSSPRRRSARPAFGSLVALEAKAHCGTPFRWQSSVKGVGCDCKGLVASVARELGRPEADSLYAISADYRIDRGVPTARLREGLAALFDRVDLAADALRDGDVLLLRLNGAAQHLAIVTEGGARAVHAQIAPSDKVKETNLELLLKACPLHSAWRWRDINHSKGRKAR